jgi:O-acetylhomoserine (thiol)-lyase
MNDNYKFETQCLHAGQQPDPATTARGVPVHRTSSYVFKSTEHAANLFALKELGNIYTRIMNPTQDVLEQRIAALEGGAAALALASGTSAVYYTIINICEAGDEIVSATNLYGGTYTMFDCILPQFGIQVKFATLFVEKYRIWCRHRSEFPDKMDGGTRHRDRRYCH